MFTSRSASQGNASAVPPPSIDEVRRRARHRLIGAAVLVLLGVVGLSLLFDTQPRPLPVDIPIEIPAKNTQPPLALPPSAAAAIRSDKSSPARGTETASVKPQDSLGPREEMVAATAPPGTATAPTDAAQPRASAKPEVQPELEPTKPPKADAPAKPQPAKPGNAKPGEAERARALLEGKPADKPADPPAAGALRIVVQVGAFEDATRAREARLKLERAGLKTYTQVAQTADGKRIRVRVGPFANQAEADKAAARVKALGLPAAVLTL